LPVTCEFSGRADLVEAEIGCGADWLADGQGGDVVSAPIDTGHRPRRAPSEAVPAPERRQPITTLV